MSTVFGHSSELYFIEPQDIANLADTPLDKAVKIEKDHDVIVLIGNHRLNISDTLAFGRDIVQNAILNNISHIAVKFVFISEISRWNIFPYLLKKLRNKYKFESKQVYHTTLTHLRNLHIERGFRNAENAYVISERRWYMTPEVRASKYKKLQLSLQENGFDDKYPISIMLCRRFGIKDSVDDGHHRIGICVENNIERISIHFRAAGALPHIIQKLGNKILNNQHKHHI